jgi:hypothetical protein
MITPLLQVGVLFPSHAGAQEVVMKIVSTDVKRGL